MDILDFAMKMEKDGEGYYRKLADECGIPGLKQILCMLAEDEVEHHRVLKELKEDIGGAVRETQVLSNARSIFAEMRETESHAAFEIPEVARYRKALEIEEKSETFYRENAEKVKDPRARALLLEIAEQERKHRYLITNVIEFLSRPQSWVENAEFYHLDEY